MKLNVFRKIITLIFLSAAVILVISCQNTDQSRNSDQKGKVIQAYQDFYAAVKSKDTEKIKQMMSKNSLAFAEVAAGRQNKPMEEVLKNGFTATTFSETLPEIRDERIKDGFGAVEVWNARDKRWEDLPFILEDGVWKFAMGDAFNGKFKSPGKGLAAREMETSNTAGNTLINIQPPPNVNSAAPNTNSNIKIIKPKLVNITPNNGNANK